VSIILAGWTSTDYTEEAKRKFLIKNCKAFKQKSVYNRLKKALPKYEINIAYVNFQVCFTLLLYGNANDEEENTETGEEEGAAGAPGLGMYRTMGRR
jgi:hypothetical protein